MPGSSKPLEGLKDAFQFKDPNPFNSPTGVNRIEFPGQTSPEEKQAMDSYNGSLDNILGFLKQPSFAGALPALGSLTHLYPINAVAHPKEFFNLGGRGTEVEFGPRVLEERLRDLFGAK